MSACRCNRRANDNCRSESMDTMTPKNPIASRRVREKTSVCWLEYGQRNPIATLAAAALTCGGLILMGFFRAH